MSEQQEQLQPDDGESGQKESARQQESQSQPEGHGGQGSDSAMKQMRIWEQRRASNSGGKRRQGPG